MKAVGITILYTLRKKGTEVSQSVRSHFFFFYNSEPSRLRLFQICSIASIPYFYLQL